ncbi:3'(2'),5'-bisphosphate nucleotidase CysQ [Defluviimonas sp. WL0050]|uniref:3'(2'),5'-bisphosphate nucleotidase CysQ n=1 Tax=Albidovulum litorale TaxID=2984134 RepID=A0ABT2ZMQ4_9RHOB|nr:3'(2'),5'-bisphosphate nucleotidase CysQ [Defluviimonas sp. WL0050]MCV2872415.1 3'(2'),5'-bisphosphate nucleotidase CysQ [Defluviimonas sp. WL0050]
MPASDLDLLIEAAREAGRIARGFFRRDPGIWQKPGDAGPVTEADLAVNRMLHAELAAARPDYGWLSEETPDDGARLRAERCFIIDPIDGTRAFIEGDTSWSHSLAVAVGGQITAAVVFLPMRDALYAATEDGAATLNHAPIRASAKAKAGEATLLTAKSNLSPDLWKAGAPPPFTRKFRASVAWRLCLVAEGRFDAMLTLRPSWEWDIAAGDLIARRAGATVTDRQGARLSYNAADPRVAGVIAAPGPLWSTLREGLIS